MRNLDEDLADLTYKVAELLTAQQDKEELERKLAAKNNEIKRLSEFEIPGLMDQAGVSEFKLSDGQKVTVRPFYTGRINDETKFEAFNYLADKGLDSIIKQEVAIKVDYGDQSTMEEVAAFVENLDLQATTRAAIHHQTLGGTIREQEELGDPLPEKLFNVYKGRRTYVK